ncbi:MAG TPA: hypothetical protein GX517_02200 [Alicyclobacillus sp.]|nr:hypothetical protein [Alicyclobacillus sp.]
MWVFFLWVEIVLTALMMGITLDVNHTFKIQTMLQGAADAASLAGAFQNHEVTVLDAYNAPIGVDFVLNNDNSPEYWAQQAWDKNVSSFTEGAGFGVVPQFTRTFDNKGIECTVQQTVHMTVSQTVTNKLFGSGPDVKIDIPVDSVAKAIPYENGANN